MKMRSKLTLILFVLLSLTGGSRLRSTNANPVVADLKRMQFQIATIREHAGERAVISSSVVEGPPGTDFDIDIQGERFKMKAKFLTDVDESRALTIRAKLQTRRLYGYSAQGLPLYEEDEQSQTLPLGLDEDIILLPFGRGGEDRLKIEITPAMTQEPVYSPSGELRPLAINILKISQGGIVNIRASKIPHHYEAEARLLEDGREIARSAANLLFEEAHELLLQSDNQAIAVNLKINEYMRSRPADQIAINFDIHRIDASGGRREPVALNWAGVARLGSDISYDLSERYAKKYELRFNIKIAKGEIVD